MTSMRWNSICLLLGALTQFSVALQPKELEDWLASSEGLAMSRDEAAASTSQYWNSLAMCGVEIKQLQSLKDVLYDHSGIDLGMSELRSKLMTVAEQHVSPAKLAQLYQVLSTGYTLYGGLALPKPQAQSLTIELAIRRAEPDQLKALYQVMYGYSGLGFPQKQAQQSSIELAVAGADAAQFKATYSARVAQRATADMAFEDASFAAVSQNLQGLQRRYAADGALYTAPHFRDYYGQGAWLTPWGSSPLEKRMSSDRRAYTASQFSRHFRSWQSVWEASQEATQVRLAEDGKPYTMLEYQQYYGSRWQEKWYMAPELACKECAPYATLTKEAVLV
eukprot:gb/GFBE01049584.1/.p1 GENE.gb/GFBE01049584.1/~~gb/GFBE01049584.1/.p1  ORF type:complete len:335 (+),score=66.44 gb/GFBE01049584.1/:1-1005(+)